MKMEFHVETVLCVCWVKRKAKQRLPVQFVERY